MKYLNIIFLIAVLSINVSADNIYSDGTATITWNAVTLDINGDGESGSIYYYIYCTETLVEPITSLNFIGATTNTYFSHYDPRNLDPEITLHYFVSAVDEWGNESSKALDSTLPVSLSSFTVEQIQGFVQLDWITQSENDHLGFNILRAADKQGTYEKINPSLIKSAGQSTSIQTYQFIDENTKVFTDYYYQIESIDINGSTRYYGPEHILVTDGIPDNYMITQNYPNPFNPVTTIRYALPEDAFIDISVYNLQGEHVATLINAEKPAGSHSIVWNGLNNKKTSVASGVYFYKITAPGFSRSKKMILTR